MQLAWLLNPISVGDFRDNYWAKQSLRIDRQGEDYYSHLLSEKELDFILYRASFMPGAVEILCGDERIERCPSHSYALESLRQGKSIRIDSIQRFSNAITELCRTLEQEINSPLNVNMYLSPGSGKKALDRHYDTHDVLVAQIRGKKNWRLYDSTFHAPLEFLPLMQNESPRDMRRFRLAHDFSGRDECKMTESFTLDSGDLLYLPRGFWHEAETVSGEISCHLTIGIQPTTYLDVFSIALSSAASRVADIRESLPFGFVTNGLAKPEIGNRLNVIASELSTSLDFEAALETLKSRFLQPRRTAFDNSIFSSADRVLRFSDLTMESKVHIRVGMFSLIDNVSSNMVFRFGDKEFAVSAPYESACRFIAETKQFVIKELPGHLTETQRLLLVHQLISEGLLVVQRDKYDALVRKPSWFPIEIDANSRTVKWIDVASTTLREPFLHQAITRMVREGYRTRITEMAALMKMGRRSDPAGFIFHISRCGSTLLSNSLRNFPGACVLSEPQTISNLMDLKTLIEDPSEEASLYSEEDLDKLMKGLIEAYGQCHTGSQRSLIIKFSSWNIRHLSWIRRLWPDVPGIVITRDPLEVAVSWRDSPPSWIGRRRLSDTDSQRTNQNEKYHATLLRDLLGHVASAIEVPGYRIIDYRDIKVERIREVARFFRLRTEDVDDSQLMAAFSVYSKDSSQRRPFVGDVASKQERASGTLREEIRVATSSIYQQILNPHGTVVSPTFS